MQSNNSPKPWAAFSEKLYAAAVDLFDTATATNHDRAKITALALLGRTISTFKSLSGLVDSGQVVDARTLARSCFENFFWGGGLATQGEAFIQKMKDDHEVNGLKFGKPLLNYLKDKGIDSATEKKLTEFIDNLEATKKGKSDIKHWNEAEAAGISDAYLLYRVLSTDAAHPSATSLSRHFIVGANDQPDEANTVTGPPKIEPDEDEETLQYACTALLGVCVIANDIINGGTLPPELEALIVEFRELSPPSAP